MTTPEMITRREIRGSARLWAGLLIGPVAWAIQLGSNWFLSEVVACRPTGGKGEVFGIQLDPFAALLNTVLLAATVAAGILAWRSMSKLDRDGDDTTAGRARWMARGGVINSITFGSIIAVSYFAAIFNPGCVS
jgi:hypothetical protein